MTGHPLDRPVWNCLTGPQADLAERHGTVVRIDPAYGPFAANADGTAEGLAAVFGQGQLWLVECDEVAAPPQLRIVRTARLTQMVADQPVIEPATAGLVVLGEADAEDMARLAHATEPGPWSGSTHRYGGFLGIHENGRLVAMAGTRMRPSRAFAEVSGVCSDPAVRGRGYARQLMMQVMAGMVAQGKTPFLHSYSANEGAIRLYRSLGFVERREMTVTVLEVA